MKRKEQHRIRKKVKKKKNYYLNRNSLQNKNTHTQFNMIKETFASLFFFTTFLVSLLSLPLSNKTKERGKKSNRNYIRVKIYQREKKLEFK